MIKINELVSFNGHQGYVKYVGAVHFRPGVWVGIELSSSSGKNDGEVADRNGVKRRYFQCKPLHGLFAKSEKVIQVQKKSVLARKYSRHASSSGYGSTYGYAMDARDSKIGTSIDMPKTTAELSVLKSTLDEYQSQIKLKDNYIEEKDTIIDELSNKLMSKDHLMKEMEVQLNQYSTEMGHFEDAFNSQTIDELTIENVKLQQSLSDADNEIKVLQEHYAKVINNQKETIHQLQQQEHLDTHEKDYKKAKLKLEEQSAKIDNLEIIIENLKSNKQERGSTVDYSQDIHDYQMKIADLEISLEQSLKVNAKLEQERDSNAEELSKVRSHFVEIKKENSSVTSKLKSIEAENQALKKKIELLKEMNKFQGQEDSDSEIVILKNEIHAMEELFEIKENNLLNELAMVKKSNDLLKQKSSQMNGDLQRKSLEVIGLSKKLFSSENNSTQKLAEVESELDEAMHRTLVLESDLSAKENTIERMQSEIESTKNDNERLKRLSNSLKKSRRETMSSYMENVDRLMTDMSKIQGSISTDRKSSLVAHDKRQSQLTQSNRSSTTYEPENFTSPDYEENKI